MSQQRQFSDLGLVLVRLALASVFVFHGSQKLFGWFGGYGIDGTAQWMGNLGIPLPIVSTVLAGSAELFGGLLIGLGAFVRLVSIPVAFTMLVAGFTAHSGFDASQGGMEYPLVLALVTAGIGLTGAGRWSVDGWRTEREVRLPGSA
ncbi:MAG: DoxX family protein [Planctomycetota bacterium]